MRDAAMCWGLLIVALVNPARVRAQADVPVALSMPEAAQRAARSALAVVLAAGQIREAQALRVGAGVIMPVNPRLALDARAGLSRDSRGTVGMASTLDLMFEVGGGPGARLREADSATEASRSAAVVARSDARLAASQAYVSERMSALRGEHAREAIELARRVLQAALERSDSGAGSAIDVTSARVELAEYQAQLHAAEADRRSSELQLRYLLAIPVAATLQLTTSLDTPAPAGELAALIERARAHWPELAARRGRLQLLAASDERLRAEAFPKVGAFVGVDASPRSPVFGLLGMSVELPVAQRNQGPRARLAAQRRTELDAYELTSARLEIAVRAIHDTYQAQLEELTVLTRDGLPAAREHLQMVETGWRAGRFDIFRLTTAAQSFVRLKAARVRALTQIWQQLLLLDRITGGMLDERT